jgi:stage V sporulation protein SpoVS
MVDDVKSNANVSGSADETLLLVSGSKGEKTKDDHKEYVKKLANAILQVFSKHGEAHLRCVGAASLNNAVKACIIAKGEAKKKNENILFDFSFTTVQIQGEDKTGVIVTVVSA